MEIWKSRKLEFSNLRENEYIGTTNKLKFEEKQIIPFPRHQFKKLQHPKHTPKTTLKEKWDSGKGGKKHEGIYLTDEDITKSILSIIKDPRRPNENKIGYVDPIFIPWKYDESLIVSKNFKIELDPDEYDLVFIPINNRIGDHWSMCIYMVKENIIYHYDSVASPESGYSFNGHILDQRLDFLKKINFFKRSFKLVQAKKWYRQLSGWECGYYCILCVFMFVNIEFDNFDRYINKFTSDHREVIDRLLNQDLFQ